MATEETSSSLDHLAQFVGNAFVMQYYHVLVNYPHMAHKFYNESSILSWPETDHETTPVTTIKSIKEKIQSLDYKGCKAEITTLDAQYSYDKNGGYYVANDIFRFLELIETSTSLIVNNIATKNVPNSPLTFDKETFCASNQPMQNNVSSTDEITSNGREKRSLVVKKVVVKEPRNSNETNGHIVAKQDSNVQKDTKKISYETNGHRVAKKDSNVQNDTKKISYASMVLKESTKTSMDHQCTPNIVIVAPSRNNQEDCASAKLKQSTPRSNNAAQTINTHKRVKAIFVGNLPLNASIEQVEKIFKTFGSIKKNGVQIRRRKDGFCYGFVEFKLSISAHKAIETRNIEIGLKSAYIAEKRDPNQGSDNRRFYNGNYNGWGNFSRKSWLWSILDSAIVTLKEESTKYRARNVEPVLKKFIPLKKNCNEDEETGIKEEDRDMVVGVSLLDGQNLSWAEMVVPFTGISIRLKCNEKEKPFLGCTEIEMVGI
ncbi:nuclear transport factor 2-like [Actinidia eriantha]|uniref:nuclear transport factor 2-like n=1 Tax=Actinidia eriantha TaxID=165200 RepID=UPI00258494A9|nr:nuclear transport factor 2-like [Actinidia eriantha]